MDGPTMLGKILNHTLNGKSIYIDRVENCNSVNYPVGHFCCDVCSQTKKMNSVCKVYSLKDIIVCSECMGQTLLCFSG